MRYCSSSSSWRLLVWSSSLFFLLVRGTVTVGFVLPTALKTRIWCSNFGGVIPPATCTKPRARRRLVTLAAARTNTTVSDEAATTTNNNDNNNPQDELDIGVLLSQADPTVDAPLPPAYTSCPFTGILAGPQSFYRQASQALKAPSLFSFLHKDTPNVEVVGGANIRTVLNQEFTAMSSNAVVGISQLVCGTQTLRTCQDATEHKALRDLVSAPLSATAVAASIPRLAAICRHRIEHDMLLQTQPQQTADNDNNNNTNNQVITTLHVTQAMALDVVWQQLLGLNLTTNDDIQTFHAQTSIWLRGMYSRPGSPELEATLQAREYLVHAMATKIEELRRAGQSDGSTMGELVFAQLLQDDDIINNPQQQRSLTDQQVIENALLLMMAGVETSASNLANAILLMGLHPHVWQKVVAEQESLVQEYGSALTRELIDESHCPYLQAVLQETLRILPVTLVSRRVTTQTILVDKYQIPQGWAVGYNIFLTHHQDPSVVDTITGCPEEDKMDLIKGFRPERWLDARTRPSRKDYIPFGVGPRHCPGALLAMTEMKVFLAIMARSIQHYELVNNYYDTTTSSSDEPVDAQIPWKKINSVPIPQDGVQIRIVSKQ